MTGPDAAQQPFEAIAVIDVGSNSMCLMVAAVLRDGTVVPVAKHKDAARLRDEVDAAGQMSAVGEQRALDVLGRFAVVMANWGVTRCRVVATAALRAAVNGDQVARRLAAATGLTIDIIEGVEEARLAWRGVLGGMAAGVSGTVLCADVGGGSTELLVSRDGEVVNAVSIPIGALVVTRRWLGADPVAGEAIALARAAVRDALVQHTQEIAKLRIDKAIAASGTIQRVARIRQALRSQSVDVIHGLFLSVQDLAVVSGALEAAPNNAERLAIPAMDPSRSDILLGGALVYQELADLLKLPGWVVSLDGLRMGVLRELACVS